VSTPPNPWSPVTRHTQEIEAREHSEVPRTMKARCKDATASAPDIGQQEPPSVPPA
jgi:hypothetical protein